MNSVSIFFIGIFASFSLFAQPKWTTLESGLWLLQASMPQPSAFADSKVTVLKISPSHFNFHLVLATENGLKGKPINEWASQKNLVAAINAGMFHGDPVKAAWLGLVNTGYTRNFQHINNPVFNSDKAFIAFNPKEKNLPAFQIIDKTCQPFQTLLSQYQSVVQGIRMIDCNQKIVWANSQKQWSIAIMCTDKEGHCLFVHCRSPYPVHNFMNQLLSILPEINRAIYLEGGPESSLFVNTPKQKLGIMGSFETGFYESDANQRLWDLPNIIGITRKLKSSD